MIFSDEVHKLFKNGIKSIQIPHNYPQFILYSETSKRVSVCQVCRKPIPKQTQRITLLTAFRGQRVYNNGGTANAGKFFFHRDCIRDVLDNNGNGVVFAHSNDSVCWDCRQPMQPGTSETVCVGSRAMYGRICQTCASAPRYRLCGSCGVLFNKYITSPTVEERYGEPVGTIICDHCADVDGYITVKLQKRAEKSERKFQAKYEELVERMERGEVF